MNDWLILLVKIPAVLVLVLSTVPFLVWMERKVSADFQRRVGPNRVGPFGLFQLIADAVKLMFKENLRPTGRDAIMYFAAPVLVFLPGLINFGLIPMGELRVGDSSVLLAVSHADLGIIVVLAVSSLASYGIAYAGWSSGNQYALLGGIRSSAQLISYEIILGLSVISLIMITGTLNLTEIVLGQAKPLFGVLPSWNLFQQPVTFGLFLVAAFAETNRAPFDLPEAEQELVGGYHTEYGGMRYAWFMFGEYAGMFTMCALITTLFLGGWTFPGITENLPAGWIAAGVGFGIFLAKVYAMIFFFMWVRWTLPRFRWDQLMKLGWQRLIPIGLVNLVVTAGLILWRAGAPS